MADRITVELTADNKLSPELRKVTGEVQGFGDAARQKGAPGIGAMTAAFAGAQVAASAAMSAFGGFTDLLGKGVGAAFEYQGALKKNEIAFKTLLGSAQEAGSFLSDLEQFAATTPFEMPGLTKASQLFLSVGVEAKNVIPVLKDLGGAITVAGGSSEDIERATVQIAQMGRVGKVTQENLGDLANSGVNGMKILADATGKSQGEIAEAISKGEVKFSDFVNALHKVSEEKGWADTLTEGSQTLEGSLSTLNDAARKAAGEGLKFVVDASTDLVKIAAEFVSSEDFQGAIKGIGAAGEEVAAILKEDLGPALQGLVEGGGFREFAEGAATNFRNFLVGLDYVGRQVGLTTQTIGRQFDDVTTIIAGAARIAGEAFGGLGEAIGKFNQGDFKGAFDAVAASGKRMIPVFDIVKGKVADIGQSFADHQKASRANAEAAAEDGARITGAFTTAFDAVSAGAKKSADSFTELEDATAKAADPKKLKAFSEALTQVAKDEAKAHADAAREITDIQARLNEDLDKANAKRAETIKGLLAQEKEAREGLEDRLAELTAKRNEEKAGYEKSYNDLVVEYSKAQTQEQRDAIAAQITEIQKKESEAEASFKRQGDYGKQYADLISQLQQAQTQEQRDSIEAQIKQIERKERTEGGAYDKAFALERQKTINAQIESDNRILKVNTEAQAAIDAACKERDQRIAAVNEREANEIAKSAEKRQKLVEDNQEIGKYVDINTGKIDEQRIAIEKATQSMRDMAKVAANMPRVQFVNTGANMPNSAAPSPTSYDSGGLLNEPVFGRGAWSGMSYGFAMQGPERFGGVQRSYDGGPVGGTTTVTITIPITVQGFVGNDQDIAKRLAPAIREELVKIGLTNIKVGGRI